MITNAQFTSQQPLYTRNLQGVLYGVMTLSRFSLLNTALKDLNHNERKNLLTRVSSLASRHLENTTNDPNPIERKLTLLSELAAVHPAFPSFYDTNLPFDRLLKTLSKDPESMIISPFRVSSLGLNGPTLLVSYSRANSATSDHWVHNAVIKWTSELEFSSTRLFHFLFQLIEDATCKVPESSFLNLNTKEYLRMDESRTPIPDTILDALKGTTLTIAQQNRRLPSDDNLIMISEKIIGSNLRDFIIESYASLTDAQKQSLFHSLGKISFFDLALGNLDRLVQVKKDFLGLVLGPNAPSNPGNLMIKKVTDPSLSPILYAIDNNIHILPGDTEKYINFLSIFLNTRYKADLLARNIINSIRASFTLPASPFYQSLEIQEIEEDYNEEDAGVDDETDVLSALTNLFAEPPTKPQIEAAHIRNFLTDLDSFGKRNLAAGITEAETKLKNTNRLLPTSFEESFTHIAQERITKICGENT